VIRKVGSGGFATVWLARDEELEADVAIKVLSEHWVDDLDVRRRFVEEGRFLRRVETPYVVGVHDIGETPDKRPFLVLTYADRGTLADRLESEPLEIAAAVEIIGQVGSGLQELHDRGMLHRDVKPANVLFRSTPTGERAMLGDLGLGKSLDAVSRVTLPGGTPAYVSPEQVRGDQLDPRADLYSLAAVTYALAGRPPYGAESLAAVLDIDGPPDPMRTTREEIPVAMDDVVLKGLERDRDDRWPDVKSFTQALQTAAASVGTPEAPQQTEPAPEPVPPESEPTTVPAPVPEAVPAAGAARRSRSRAWLAAGIATVVLGGLGGYAGVRLGTERQWVEARDQTGALSVRLPRAWAQDATGSGWRPAGASTVLPGLLASADNTRWADPSAAVAGVFVGLLPPAQRPAAPPVPAGCNLDEAVRSPDGQTMTSVFRDCPAGMTRYERVLVIEGQAVRVQVRLPAADEREVNRVLDSVTYRPSR